MKNLVKVVCVSVLLSVMAFTGTVPFKNITAKPTTVVNAENDYDGEFAYQGRRYQYREKGASEIGLVRVLDFGGEIAIPSKVNIEGNTYTVTTLEDWFGAGQSFSKVYVPNTVRTIAKQVFYGAKMDVLQISNNLETVGGYFCSGAKVNSVSCNSKKITNIEGGAFFNANCPEIIIFGDWLVKLKAKSGSDTLDMTSSKLSKVKKACICAIEIDESITNLKLSTKIDNYDVILTKKGFTRICNIYIENVYVDGKKISCKSADDTCPDIIKNNYVAFEGTPFSLNYSYDKAKYLLNSMGIKYYGKECEKVKGTLSGGEEYEIALKLHDYIVNNYVYDKTVDSSFDIVFNCHTITKCQFDAEMYAFLLECAGVESEVVFSGDIIPLSSSEKEKYVQDNPGIVHPKTNFKYGGYDGNHAWDAVKIGGKWYYVDTTGDRTNDFYALFLFSNETIENGNLFWSESYTGEDGIKRKINDPGHAFPHFSNYELYDQEDWVNEWLMSAHPFQNRKTMLDVPNCNETNGDIDNDYYCYNRYNEEEVKKYKAFLLQDEYMKRRIVNSTDGYIYASKEEIKKLNGSGGGYYVFHLVEEDGKSKVKLLINYKVLDINCDGEYNAKDLVALMQRSQGKPSYNK